jgi:phage shock protein A
MTIMTRFMRLCKADIHGVMDQLEDRGLVLKQVLRDMGKELDRKDATFRKMEAAREQAQRDCQKYAGETGKLEQDLAVAIEKDKDDIARVLIRKLKPLLRHQEELERHRATLDREIAEFQHALDAQRIQHEQLQLRSAEYFRGLERREWEKTVSVMIPSVILREPSEEEIEIELLQRKEAVKKGKKRGGEQK